MRSRQQYHACRARNKAGCRAIFHAPTRAPRVNGQRGFTLLEAVVAMVLISGAGLALFAWINTELSALSRLQQTNARVEAMVNVVEYMHTVNPMLSPEGGVSFAAYRLTWKAKAVTAVQDGVSYPRGMSLYQLALYDNYVAVQQADGTRWFDLTLRQVGYKRVRDNKLF
ncbi:MAG: type II secretion system protein [Betaproteobacteria bacterium]|nr:type II secretion system protein [Betaproteobacteria bacterium]